MNSYSISINKSSQVDNYIKLSQIISHSADMSQIKLIIKSGIKVTILDDLFSAEKNILIQVNDYAQVKFSTCDANVSMLNLTAQVHLAGQIEIAFIQKSDKSNNIVLQTNLLGKHSSAHIFIAQTLFGKSNSQVTTLQCHDAPNTSSTVTMRVLGYDTSKSSYEGMIIINHAGFHTNAQQDHKALLLSNSSCASAKPQLEVLTNDVQCGHGSAVGMLDKEQLWYMVMRGMDQERAMQLLLKQFLSHAQPAWGEALECIHC